MGVLRIAVSTMDRTEVFEVKSGAKGQELQMMVNQKFELPESPLFGLQYEDSKGFLTFLQPEKKIAKQDVKKEDTLKMHFCAKFYPEIINEELTAVSLRRLLWLQIRDVIVKDELYCPAELCVLFAAQSAQASLGDFNPASHGVGTLNPAKELPERVLRQHALTMEQWEDRIKHAWNKLKGIPSNQAISDYLNIAQDLEMYGVTFFEVTNKKGTKLWLGVHNLGMDIYEYNNKVTPRLGFPWTEIRNISFNDKKFKISMVNKEAPSFKFYAPRFRINKRILALCVGNHEFYTDRRRAQRAGTMIAEDRATTEAKIRWTKEQILGIRKDLETVLDQGKLTAHDKIHNENEKAGMDKYKTMKRAQSGDAKRRVDEFEKLDDTEC